MTDVSSLNVLLNGYTIVEVLSFESDFNSLNSCQLHLALRRDDKGIGPTLRLTFSEVANLALSNFGGGLTQLLCLQVTDVRDRQLDRLNFEVADLENSLLSFMCRAIEIC